MKNIIQIIQMKYQNDNNFYDDCFLEEDFTINNEYEDINKYFKSNEFRPVNFQSFDEYNYLEREISDNNPNLRENKDFFALKKQKDDFITIIKNKNWKEETKKNLSNYLTNMNFIWKKIMKVYFLINQKKLKI